jgi:hypothetical protein
MTDHPITPPAYLLKRWEDAWFDEEEHPDVLLIQAFQAGADQELEACCALLQQKGVPAWSLLRMHRRPKPPSLKEQALEALNRMDQFPTADDKHTICRALEQLDD